MEFVSWWSVSRSRGVIFEYWEWRLLQPRLISRQNLCELLRGDKVFRPRQMVWAVGPVVFGIALPAR